MGFIEVRRDVRGTPNQLVFKVECDHGERNGLLYAMSVQERSVFVPEICGKAELGWDWRLRSTIAKIPAAMVNDVNDMTLMQEISHHIDAAVSAEVERLEALSQDIMVLLEAGVLREV